MISFWERESFTTYDYIIIGSGIVGLSTAISLKEADPAASVLVLERGILPTGASTKNAGFACFGSLTEILADFESMGESAAVKLVEERWLGLEKLRSRLGDEAIDYQNLGGYELISSAELDAIPMVEKVNDSLKHLFPKNVFSEKSSLIKVFGFNSDEAKALIFNPFEGQLDSGKMMNALISYANRLNIRICTGAEVLDLSESSGQAKLKVSNTVTSNSLLFQAKKVAVCTNAFTNKLLPHLKIEPARGIVLVTKPIPELPFKGTFHMDEGFYYFRNFRNRIIFGGGRNIDFSTEATTNFDINEKILAELTDKLSNVILPTHAYEVDMVWAGIMGFGPNKKPTLEKISPNIVAGVGLGGMGVAIGTSVGEKISRLLFE